MLERKITCEDCGEDYPPNFPHNCVVPTTEAAPVKVERLVSRQDSPGVELLSCPFCGGLAQFKNVQKGFRWWVVCTKCMCKLPTEPTKEDAAHMWNIRA